MKKISKKRLFGLGFALVILSAVFFRGVGLWHGLEQGIIYHPSAQKQVHRLENYLRGDYVQRCGGQPCGLARVDEGLLRAWMRSKDLLGIWLSGRPDRPLVPPDPPAPARLYAQCRVLRLLYGVLAALLVFASARRWGAGRLASLAGAALYAVSPLAITVTHAATGDVGVDLFVAAALYAASAQAVGGSAPWWLVFGAACGAGWACKFQGALAAWMALPPLLLGLRDGWRGWRRLAGAGVLAAIGFVGAALLLDPALWLDAANEWRETWRHCAFGLIGGLPQEQAAWPLGRKVAWGLTHNVPFVAGCQGWGMVLLGLVSSGMLVAAAWRTAVGGSGTEPGEEEEPADAADPTEPEPTPEEARASAESAARCSRWLLGIATFPWLAFLLAAVLKPEIQPYHFSFLVPPLALCMALAMSWCTEPPDGEPRPLATAVTILLAVAVLAGEVYGSAREMFFWRRPDTKDLAKRQSEALFGTPGWSAERAGTNGWLKRYCAEPATLPGFRNRPSFLSFPPGAWREDQLLLPVPSVPMPADPGTGWIFPDGPVFPRNDRMFTVPASGTGHRPPMTAADGSPLMLETIFPGGAWTERILVFQSPPRKLVLGLRTGRLPARCKISTGRFEASTPRLLPPESQTVLELPRPDPVYTYPADGATDRPAIWACRLRVNAQLGPVWVTILGSPEERAIYELHGPRLPAPAPSPESTEEIDSEDDSADAEAEVSAPPPAPASHPIAGDLPLYSGELEFFRYLDSDTPYPIPEASADGLPPPVPGAGPGLAAGPYRFRARVHCPTPATVTLLLADRDETDDAPDTLPSASHSLPAGDSDLDWPFTKPFAPYGATLRATADIPGTTLLFWTLKPDPEALAAVGSIPPAPATPLLPGGIDPDSIPVTPLGAVYPGTGVLLDLRIPDTWHVSDTIPHAVSVRLDPRISHKKFGNLAVFLRLENDNGELVAPLACRFDEASFEGGPLRWKLGTPDLPPGTYTLRAGFADGPLHGAPPLWRTERENRSVFVKTVTVLPD